jgi:hypothetical protein
MKKFCVDCAYHVRTYRPGWDTPYNYGACSWGDRRDPVSGAKNYPYCEWERETKGHCRLARCARGKEGEDRIADDIEHVPALLHHGAGGAIEIDIEQIEEGFNGKRVGKAGRIAQVAVPKRRGEPLASAAA